MAEYESSGLCDCVCALHVPVLGGQRWGQEKSGLVSMKPIGAGRIGGLVMRETGLVKIWVKAVCVCVCFQEDNHSGRDVQKGMVKVFSSLKYIFLLYELYRDICCKFNI